MKKNIKNICKSLGKIPVGGLGAVLIVFSTSCSTDAVYLNPSSASEQQAINDPNGLIALCNGAQYRFTVGRASPGYTAPTASGLTTKELNVLNAGNAAEDALRQGAANVDANNAVTSQLWAQSNIVKANADLILANANKVQDPGLKSGIIAYASIFRAQALGTMAQFWQQITIQTGNNATFVGRDEALKQAIATLESAASALATAPSTGFTGRIAPGIDLANTVQALIARYAIMLGDNDKALAAAAKVDLTKKSSYSYDDASRNPLFETSFSNRNVCEPFVDFGLPASLKPTVGDKRTGFYYTPGSASVNTGRTSFYTANTASVPVYLPGEMLLIRAEAFARKGQLTDAVAELNKVLTKKTDSWGIGADLPAYSGTNTADAILTEIYKNRCIELFLSGLRLEDSRRFKRPGPGEAGSERSRNWYPYPNNERLNNSSTPADPAL